MAMRLLYILSIAVVAQCRHQVSTRGLPYAVFDANKPSKIAFDEGTFKYPFNTTDWHSRLQAKGLSIDIARLDQLYFEIGEEMDAGYAYLETYIKPDTVTATAGDYSYGAWKVQILVEDFVWKYKIAQVERYVSCKQDWQDQVTNEITAIFRITLDTWYNYWTSGTSCTFQIVSPLISQVVGDLDVEWNRRMIAHSEL